MAVGKLGENISVKRIDAFYAPKDAEIYGGSHPKGHFLVFYCCKFIST